MKLQKKTSLVLIPLSLLLCTIGIVCMITFINPVFTDWAFKNTYKNTNLAIEILEYDLTLLSTVVKDYSEWTELYEYVDLESADFTESNIDLDSLGYDIGFIVNKDKKIIYCEKRNEDGEIIEGTCSKEKIDENFKKFINEYNSGFIKFDNVYYMFATSPITDSTKRLPINGYMFFGKKFDEENNVTLWNEFFDLKIDFVNPSDYKIEDIGVENYTKNLKEYKGIKYSINQIDYSQIKSSFKLLDIDGINFSNVEIITNTDFLSEGRIGIMYCYLIMFLSFIVFMFTILKVLIKAEVLSPISKIGKKIVESNIYHNDFINSIDTGSESELVLLENVVDNYIKSINSHNDEILELNLSLENKIISRTKELSDLNEKLKLLDIAIDASKNGILITDEKGVIIKVNEGIYELQSFNKGELVGKKIDVLISSEYDNGLVLDLKEKLKFNDGWIGEFVRLDKQGTERTFNLTINKVVDKEKYFYIAIFVDISALKEKEKKLESQAYSDSLTGIANRAFFYRNINRVFNRVKRKSNTAALLYMDLDGFKEVNDTYGHDVGDEVLIQFSNRIKERIRVTDFFARIGGDEFTIIIEDVESEYEITSLIDMIVEIESEDIVVDDIMINIGVSVGYSIIDKTRKNIHEVIKLADNDMYVKKQQNRRSKTNKT